MILVEEIGQQKKRPRCYPAKALCWRQDLAVPHESLWCRLNKLEVLNRAKLKLFEEELRNPRIVRNSTHARGWADGDLRVVGFRDKEKVRRLSAPGHTDKIGALVDYISGAEESRWVRDAWASQELSYCPVCVKAGVHVTYFQFRFINVCPVHRVRLVNHCPSCKAHIAYTIRETFSAERFACHCGHRLWNWENDPTNRASDAIKTRHAKAGDWICRVAEWGAALHCAWDAEKTIPTMGNEGLATFATFATLARPSFGKLSGNFQTGLEERMLTTRFLPSGRHSDNRRTSERKQLVAIYKSICRYFYRRFLRRHREAIKVVTKLDRAEMIGIDGSIVWHRPFALVAIAFVGWRMYWECVVSPDELFRFHRPYRRIDGFTSEHTHWTVKTIERFHDIVTCPKVKAPRGVVLEIKKRWFAQTCISSFDECLARVQIAFEKFKPDDSWLKRMFTTRWITGVLCPIMVPSVERDGATTLHWWRRPVTARQTRWARRALKNPASRQECVAFDKGRDDIMRMLLERTSRVTRPTKRVSRPPPPEPVDKSMVTDKIKELEAVRAQRASLERAVESELKDELSGLPAKYGFDSLEAFTRALEEANRHLNHAPGARRASPPSAKPKTKPAARPRRKRVVISDDTRALVKSLVGEGKTGAEIAKMAGISTQSVQKIKTKLGLARPRIPKTRTDLP